MKKAVSLLLTCMVLVFLLNGCTGGQNKNTDSSGSSNNASQNAKGTGEVVKLTALFNKHSLTQDVNNMEWLKQLEEDCGVEIEWQQISADWDQKKPTLFASGDIPDLLFNATTNADYIQYNGLFEDLKPLIGDDTPNIQTMFKDKPELESIVTQENGQIYGLPQYKSLWPAATSTTFINKKWLDKVNMGVPTNWDELKAVLIAFRDNDVNENGDLHDEIPMDFNPMNWLFSPKQMLGGLGLQLTDEAADGYFAEDGKVKNYFVDERFKTLMIFLQDLYQEGLINPETVTQDYSKYQSVARGNGSAAKVGFTFGWESGDRFGNELAGQYISIAPLKQHADSKVTVVYSNDLYSQNYGINKVSISAQCKNKEAAMRFIDGFYDEKVSMQVLFGGMNDVDKAIQDNGDGTYSVLPPADDSLDPGSWKWTNTFADNGPFYIRDGISLKLGSDMQKVLQEKSIYNDYTNKVDEKTNRYPQSFIKYSEEDTNTLAMNQANISNITEQQWAIWMTKKSDIEAEWQAYVDAVYKAGLTQNLEIRQNAFEEYLKTIK